MFYAEQNSSYSTLRNKSGVFKETPKSFTLFTFDMAVSSVNDYKVVFVYFLLLFGGINTSLITLSCQIKFG